MNLYNVFYSKQPADMQDLLPNDAPKFVTFLNPYTIEIAKKTDIDYTRFDYIASDAIVPILLQRLCAKNKSNRYSFDMTSVAPHLFNMLIENKMSIYFIGSATKTIASFVSVISEKYNELKIAGFHHGYILGYEDGVIEEIIKSKSDVVVVGMGAPIQDKFALRLRDAGYMGSIYTCGGFIHQHSSKASYYPKFINKYHLRWLYRMTKETYVLKRVLKYYIPFTYKYVRYLLLSSLK